MAKPFTTISALVFFAVAAVHIYRLTAGTIDITVAGHAIPIWTSWIGAALAALLGIMLLVEARR